MTNKKWIDLGEVQSLKNGALNFRFISVVYNKPEFFIGKVKARIDEEFKGFKLTFYNEAVYYTKGMVKSCIPIDP